jgi:hypothetical protein
VAEGDVEVEEQGGTLAAGWTGVNAGGALD